MLNVECILASLYHKYYLYKSYGIENCSIKNDLTKAIAYYWILTNASSCVDECTINTINRFFTLIDPKNYTECRDFSVDCDISNVVELTSEFVGCPSMKLKIVE